jgi:8-oxo-dGTP pyrophosphatase MutT (NUDIX family)
MKRRRRIAAYGLCFDEVGRVLLVREASGGLAIAGRWLVPGGGVEHGEHPAETVVREVEEETGYKVAIRGIRSVVTDIDQFPDVRAVRHQDRIVYDVDVLGGALRDEVAGTTDQAAWIGADDLATLPLLPFVASLLGVPSAPAGAREAELVAGSIEAAGPANRRQRFASYGLVTDPAGRVLLTRIANGYPGAGRWHLPGGGTDFGESAVNGLLRELAEETDQRGEVTDLIGISHHHHPAARGPEGVPMDWHGVRAVFRVRVDAPTTPRVVESHGSTVAARWFVPAQALSRPLTELAREMVVQHLP